MLLAMICFHLLIRRISLASVIGFGFVFVIVSSAILSQRNLSTFDSARLFEALQPQRILEQTLTHSGEITDMTTVTRIVQHVSNGGELLYGQSYAEVVTRFVPRAIWPGKPPGIGDETRRIFYPARYNERTGAGVPPSLFGELVWNFHFPGVIVGMMLLGFGVRTSVEYLNRSRQNPWTVLFYALTVLFLFGSIRTYFAALTMRYLIWMLLAFAVVLVVRQRK